MPQASPQLTIDIRDDGKQLALKGTLDIHTLTQAMQSLGGRRRAEQQGSLELSELSVLDSSGALFLCQLRNNGLNLLGIRSEHQTLLDLICGLEFKALPKPVSTPRWRQLLIALGKGADDAGRDTIDLITFVGHASNAVRYSLWHPRALRLASISRHVAETGMNALPIIAMMAVMISIVIGYQSVAQLRPYGGEDFTVNLVAVSMLREMGVLITAIMVAGRSGSAFVAEIGLMKARDEVDALKVMGLEPFELLVLPRLIALVVTLPLLTFFADIMGLLGGAMISHALLSISPAQYVIRVHQAVTGSDLFVGLVKAPIFAFFIAAISCMHGLRVKGAADSVGHETTGAVVKAIFLVIVLDALFSILFERLGL
ncbi:MlaE family lipid ABC transporter permease subunit [Janthinobacterium sp.]|uniref:MlaE family ABC transporter permease n=1 Tax=Janthinobacterium sp. TaxID=1871054 RepID=UPI00293D5A03|nr:MlaE family lipid ABC transporter permease subunit [Janthinobacterium sp.]